MMNLGKSIGRIEANKRPSSSQWMNGTHVGTKKEKAPTPQESPSDAFQRDFAEFGDAFKRLSEADNNTPADQDQAIGAVSIESKAKGWQVNGDGNEQMLIHDEGINIRTIKSEKLGAVTKDYSLNFDTGTISVLETSRSTKMMQGERLFVTEETNAYSLDMNSQTKSDVEKSRTDNEEFRWQRSTFGKIDGEWKPFDREFVYSK